jgi:hypothetical protein
MRRSLGGGILAALALLLACGGGGEPGAQASAGSAAISFPSYDGIPNLFRTDRTSDPEAMVFNDTLYVYTSSDLGSGVGGDGNIYPMDTTYVHRLLPSVAPSDPAKWTSIAVLHESQYEDPNNLGWVVPGTEHLWAPGIANVGGSYLLMVPDVANGMINQSHIGVSTSRSPISGFAYQGRFDIAGYASDPSVATSPDGSHYLVWANGDWGSDGVACGGLSMGQLDPSNPLHVLDQHEITISGIPQPTNSECTSLHKNHPYLEGPSLYYWGSGSSTPAPGAEAGDGPWYLVFAMTLDVPAIAYARSWDLKTFVYQGVIMDTSPAGTQHELTNQASFVRWGGDWLMFYHDGPPGVNVDHKRQVHGECVTFDATGHIVGMDYGTGAPTQAPLLRTDDGLKCARRYPVRVTLSVGANGTVSDETYDRQRRCVGTASGIGVCRWVYPRNTDAAAYWLFGTCSKGSATWQGCDNVPTSTMTTSTCAISAASPRSLKFSCK